MDSGGSGAAGVGEAGPDAGGPGVHCGSGAADVGGSTHRALAGAGRPDLTDGAAEASESDAVPASAPSTAGLTSAEVAERQARGLVNASAGVKTKPVGQIVREHVLTTFNLINVVLAALVVLTGQYQNMTFMVIVVANAFIGIVQELRAKRMVDKLTILTNKPVRVHRDGEARELAVSDLVMDDVFELSRGDQVPADAVVLKGTPTMDESLLTGESAPVGKTAGDQLFSGSFVDSGHVVARVVHVGEEGYAARISSEAKHLKPVRSEILTTLRAIVSIASTLMVPLGAGLFLRTFFMDQGTWQQAILSTVAALVGMVPQGLILLTSTVLAIATVRLGHRKVLVQQSYCVETLARVDTLCLDKTGTITSGAMEVDEVHASGEGGAPLPGSTAPLTQGRRAVLQAAFDVMVANGDDINSTAEALLDAGRSHGLAARPAQRAVPFSSERKLSGCVLASGEAFVVGAGQFVLGEAFAEHLAEARAFDPLDRVVCVAQVDGFDATGRPLGAPRVLGFVGIRDQIRPTASETIRFFKEAGVTPKVISGDDAATVSAIAQRVGVPGAEHYVDATTLATPAELEEAARTCAVFGRVTPQQKRSLVQALQAQGRTVAMTGDGVNDVLALREADCSVAMASGSAAARNVAEIVLVDNDFAHMPQVVAEGRRSINNLQRSASLFLVKTVFSAALALVCIILPPYPFVPVQMSLLSAGVIGLPSFVLALEPNHELVRGKFLVNVLKRSLPASIVEVVALVAFMILGRMVDAEFSDVSTLCLYLAYAVGVALIVRISLPMNALRVALLVVVVGMVVGASILLPGFFSITPLTGPMAILLLVGGVASVVVFNILYDQFDKYARDDGRFSRVVSRLEERNASKRSGV